MLIPLMVHAGALKNRPPNAKDIDPKESKLCKAVFTERTASLDYHHLSNLGNKKKQHAISFLSRFKAQGFQHVPTQKKTLLEIRLQGVVPLRQR